MMSMRTVVISALFVVGVVASIASGDETYDPPTCAERGLDDVCRAVCDDVVAELATAKTHTPALHGLCLAHTPAPRSCSCFVDEPVPWQPVYGDGDFDLVVDRCYPGRLGCLEVPVDTMDCVGTDIDRCTAVCGAFDDRRSEDDRPIDDAVVALGLCGDDCTCDIEVDQRCTSLRFFLNDDGDASLTGGQPLQREGRCPVAFTPSDG